MSKWAGAEDPGLAHLQRAEELLGRPENRGMLRELGMCRAAIAIALSAYRGVGAAGEHVARCMRIADEAGDRYGRLNWRVGQGLALYARYGPERARAEIGLGLELTKGLDEQAWSSADAQKPIGGLLPRHAAGRALLSLAVIEALEGELEEALRLAEETFELLGSETWSRLRERYTRASLLLFLVSRGVGSRASLLAQVERDAVQVAQPRIATATGESVEFPILAGMPELLYGQLAAAAGRRQEARERFEVARAKAGPDAMLPHVVRARLGDLAGGADGARQRAEAQAALAALGYTSPRWLDLFAARFED